MRLIRLGVVSLCGLLAAPGFAMADDVEVPTLVLDARATDGEPDGQLDLANIVQTAAKSVSSVQEAPVIVTVLVEKEIEDRGLQTLDSILTLVPGWGTWGIMATNVKMITARKRAMSTLLMRDGLSLLNPENGYQIQARTVPIETLKRIEVVSGPGGVLWGAESLFGVINMVTKDAEDINGIESGLRLGAGPGDPQTVRGYVMAGLPHMFGTRASLVAHASFESYQDYNFTAPALYYINDLPQLWGPEIIGPEMTSNARTSYIFNFDGKLQLGRLKLAWNVPWNQMYNPHSYGYSPLQYDRTEDHLPDGQCSAVDASDPLATDATDRCTDRARLARAFGLGYWERSGVASYAFGSGKTSGEIRAYISQFEFNYSPFVSVLGSNMVEGGVSMTAHERAFRSGAALDGTLGPWGGVQVLVGGEAFKEWTPNSATNLRMGEGVGVMFPSPLPETMPMPCPHAGHWNGSTLENGGYLEGCPLTLSFDGERGVVAGYGVVKWRPFQRLYVDAGLRTQAAPSVFSSIPFSTTTLKQGTVVGEFAKNWFAKLAYTEGFRPQPFTMVLGNYEALNYKGVKDINVTSSKGLTFEINTRVRPSHSLVRELYVRADYSFARLDDYIMLSDDGWINQDFSGHFLEMLSKLYLRNSSRVEFAYSFAKTSVNDTVQLMAPVHWFNMSVIAEALPKRLEFEGTLRVAGGYQDANLRTDASGLVVDPVTGNATVGNPSQTRTVPVTDAVLDRVPASAELAAGVRYLAQGGRLTVSARAENALNAKRYYSELLHHFAPRGQPNLMTTPGTALSLLLTYAY